MIILSVISVIYRPDELLKSFGSIINRVKENPSKVYDYRKTYFFESLKVTDHFDTFHNCLPMFDGQNRTHPSSRPLCTIPSCELQILLSSFSVSLLSIKPLWPFSYFSKLGGRSLSLHPVLYMPFSTLIFNYSLAYKDQYS